MTKEPTDSLPTPTLTLEEFRKMVPPIEESKALKKMVRCVKNMSEEDGYSIDISAVMGKNAEYAVRAYERFNAIERKQITDRFRARHNTGCSPLRSDAAKYTLMGYLVAWQMGQGEPLAISTWKKIASLSSIEAWGLFFLLHTVHYYSDGTVEDVCKEYDLRMPKAPRKPRSRSK